MKSSLKNMILVMLGITLVCSAAVGGVYTLTFATIEQAKAQKLKNAYGEVLPSRERFVTSSTIPSVKLFLGSSALRFS